MPSTDEFREVRPREDGAPLQRTAFRVGYDAQYLGLRDALGRVLAHMREHFAEPLSNPALARIAGRSVRAMFD